ncbi:MAG: prepilin-type N-terminal cleavage/methylation domain-containing protein [Firmicutes bacterium]|nr:prepilin-type N-terminal cleavage/methylation domain-containing protein [Bacillota bacterium]
MKLNKKGFTLVELLAVIALLGVILTIAVVSISSISNGVRERQKENLKASIKVAAQKYVNDTGITKVYVDTLIKEGLLKAENEDGIIINPVDNTSMNCHYIDYSDENNPAYKESDSCDIELFNDTMITLLYCSVATGGSCVPRNNITNDWISGNGKDIILGAKSRDTSVVDLTPLTLYSWISPLAPDVFDSNNVHRVKMPDKKYINDVYEVIVMQNKKNYSGSARVKIDAKEPVVRDIMVTDADIWKREKNITALLEDNESGLAAFVITKSLDVPTSGWINITGNSYSISSEQGLVTDNGTYYIWVKDQAGNINKSTIIQSSVVVKKIDRIAPTCTADGDNYSWTKSDVTIKYGCLDGESGCNPLYSGGENTFTTTTYSATIDAYIIKDRAGNETFCPSRTASVYVDKTAPSCTSSGDNNMWTRNNVTIMYGCDDGESGCNPSYSGGSKTFNTTTKTATIAEYVIKDKVGNSTTCAARTANVYVDKTAPSCTNSGDNYSWTNRDVTITYGCNDAESGCNASYSGGTKTFNTTTTTSKINSYTVKDKVGNSATCPARTANVYVDKTAPSCTNSGDNYSWTNRDVTITYGCLDSESGCNASYSGGTKTFNTTTMTSKINSYTIKDSAGNSKTCLARTASVYVDKTAPSITYFNVSSNDRYNSNNTTASLMGSDSHSGVDKVCLTLTNNSNTCAWIDVSNSSYSTYYYFNSYNGSGDSHILYAFVKDNAGNVSSAGSYYYRLYKTCDQTTSYSSGTTQCTKKCGGGVQYNTFETYDYYFGSSCGTKQSGPYSCNTQDCCSSTYEVCGSASACSTSCGMGTASKFCLTYSNYNGALCGSGYQTSFCYENYGCYVPPVVTPENYYQYVYVGCDEYYVTTCTGNTCNYTIKNGMYNSGTLTKNSWTTYEPAYCNPVVTPQPQPEPEESIWKIRYLGCDEYFITTCTATTCNYSQKNGSTQYGTVERYPLQPSKPAYCNPVVEEPDPEPISCSLWAWCYKNVGSTYQMHLKVSGGCTITSYYSRVCPAYDYDTTQFYVTTSDNSECPGVGAHLSNGDNQSNNFKMENGQGYYFSVTRYLPFNSCT